MHSRVILVIVFIVASSSATELVDDGTDASIKKRDEHNNVETFGNRGSGFSESSLDDPNNVYYHNEHRRIARAVPEEEGSSSLASDSPTDVEQTTRKTNLSHLPTLPSQMVPETTTRQVIHTEMMFKRRSLLTINLSNYPIPFNHRLSTTRPEKATVQNLRTTRTATKETSPVVPETDQSTRYDDLPLEEDGFLPHIYRRTRRRGDTFDPTASIQTDPPISTAPATTGFASSVTERVTELFSVESSTDDNVVTSIQSTPAKDDASTAPATHTYTISSPESDAATSVNYPRHSISSEKNKISQNTLSASSVLITQGVSPITHTTEEMPSTGSNPILNSTHPYDHSTPPNFIDPKICTHTPDDTFDITLFHEVLFSRIDCSGHVAIFGHNITLDSGLSASLLLTIYKRLQLGGLIVSRLADELNDYIYRPADFI